MKRSQQIAAGVLASISMVLAAASAHAHSGQMGGHMGPGMMQGMTGGSGGMDAGHGAMGHGAAGTQAGRHLMTAEERSAFQEKMHNAATPEERQQLVEARRAEMRKRAQDKGVALPEHRGPHAGRGTAPGAESR